MTDVTTTQSDGALPPARHRGPRQLRRSTIVAAAALVIAAIVVTVILLNRNDGKKTPSTAPQPTAGQILGGAGEQLATLLTNSRDHTFHARYAVRGDAKLLGGKLSLEWWNKKGHSRIDTTRTTDLQSAKTASFVNGTEGASCQQINSGGWSCHSIQVPAPGDPNGMIATLTAELSGRPITEHAGKVKGHDALCFHVAGGTEPIDVCTTPEGVLLRNSSKNVTYEVVSLDTDVSDSDFKPPAKVQ